MLLSIQGCISKAQILSKENLLEDIEFLNNAITAGHPVTLNAAWTNKLNSFKSNLENQQLTKYSAFEYENIIREALTKVGCAHTKIKESPISKIYQNQIGENKYIPIRCFADSTGLYIIDGKLKNNDIPIVFPVKINSINNLSAQEIINKLLVFQPVDGTQKTLGYAIINDYSEILIRRCFIGTDDFTIKYKKSNGETDELKIKAVKEYSPDKFQHFQPKSTPLISEKFITLFRLTSNTMYLRIKSMDYDNYKKINKEIFQKTISKGIENLVIDLRNNGGGTPKSSLDFLSYIISDTLSQTDYRSKGDVSHYLSSKLKLLGVWFWAQITPHQKTDSGTKYITNVTHPKNM